jgi:hypothetical protein
MNRTKADGLQDRCKPCARAAVRISRLAHPRTHYTATQNLRARNRAFAVEYLRSHPCVDCGESDVHVLEFDHVRAKARRQDAISLLVNRCASLDRLKAEIGKCVIRCANCHRKRTFVQQGWKSRLTEPGSEANNAPPPLAQAA